MVRQPYSPAGQIHPWAVGLSHCGSRKKIAISENSCIFAARKTALNCVMFKRIISVAFILCAFAFNLQAQNWEHFVTEADELLDLASHESWIYSDEQGNSFVIWSDEEENFRIVSNNGNFDRTGKLADAIIGYYDMENKLIEKTKIGLLISEGQGNQAHPNMVPMARPVYNKKRVEKLMQTIKHEQGFVRIIVPLYGTNELFDIKIPCLNNPQSEE